MLFLLARRSSKTTRMLGPYNLRYVHLFVGERSAGAYILSRNGRSADLVGLSPDDVAQVLGQYGNRSDYRYFWFTYTKSPRKAAELATSWYHRYRPTDNAAPPEGQAHSTWRCTVAGCTACALAARQG